MAKPPPNLLMYIVQIMHKNHCLFIQSKAPQASSGAAYKHFTQVSWGVGGRRFKSSRADQNYTKKPAAYGWFFITCLRMHNA
ncbi:hypothetical protein ASU71_08290 [Enterobacter hormaechei subsp. hoffmannii]|nr:hypothetical protein ASU71_08290 [Enterobacter hormaechei subsp. hoffmannii]